jgi:hypothetical protein
VLDNGSACLTLSEEPVASAVLAPRKNLAGRKTHPYAAPCQQLFIWRHDIHRSRANPDAGADLWTLKSTTLHTRYGQGCLKDNWDVIEYFMNRDKLRVLNMENDNQVIAERLYKLLGFEHGDVPYPTANKSEG